MSYKQRKSIDLVEKEQTWTLHVLRHPVLPICATDHKQTLEKLGFCFGELPSIFSQAQKYFIGAKIPKGWKKKLGQDNIHTIDIIDPYGVLRCSIYVRYQGLRSKEDQTSSLKLINIHDGSSLQDEMFKMDGLDE